MRWRVSDLLLFIAFACGSGQICAEAADDFSVRVSGSQSSVGKKSVSVVNKIVRRSAPPIVQNLGDVEFRAISEQETSQDKVGNGVDTDTALWPATFVAGSCTATLVGPEVLLTAKHCVKDGAITKIKFQDGTLSQGYCRHPEDKDDISADWALCHMEPPIVRPDLYYEFISVDPSMIRKGLRLTIGGYGCTRIPDTEMENKEEKKFRTGKVRVSQLPMPGKQWPNWILTERAKKGEAAFVCPGDSGGAVYLEEPGGHRTVVAVASAVGVNKNDYLVSYLAALSTSSAHKFLSQWLTEHAGVKICGLGENPEYCRPNFVLPLDDRFKPIDPPFGMNHR